MRPPLALPGQLGPLTGYIELALGALFPSLRRPLGHPREPALRRLSRHALRAPLQAKKAQTSKKKPAVDAEPGAEGAEGGEGAEGAEGGGGGGGGGGKKKKKQASLLTPALTLALTLTLT